MRAAIRRLSLSYLPALWLIGIMPAFGQTPNPPNTRLKVLGDAAQAVFESNQGQEDSTVKFLMRNSEYTLFLTAQEAVLAASAASSNAQMRLSLAGSRASDVEGVDPLPAKANYFLGNDPSRWLHNIPTFTRVRYRGVYPGVDLEYRTTGGQLAAEFQIAPNTDVAGLHLRLQGGGKLVISATGELVLNPGPSEVRILPPQVFEPSDAGRRTIDGHYVLEGDGQVAIHIGSRNIGHPLMIDLGFECPSCSLASSSDYRPAVGLDTNGRLYVAEQITLAQYNGGDGNGGRREAIAVRKFDETGSQTAYLTYLGGSDRDVATGLAIDKAGSAYLVGYTSSRDFPSTPGAVQTALAGGQNAFVTKIDSGGSTLVYSTYLGGEAHDLAYGVAVDSIGAAYVTGYSDSVGFPVTVTGGRSRTLEGDVFVTKLTSAGDKLEYSTTVGGNSAETGTAIAVDSSGNVYVTGFTASGDFPTSTEAFQRKHFSGSDAFLLELGPTGTQLVYSTYLGGTELDEGRTVTIGEDGNVVVLGTTRSLDFPTISSDSAQPKLGPTTEFVFSLNPEDHKVRSSYLLDSDDYPTLAIVAGTNNHHVAIAMGPRGSRESRQLYRRDLTPRGGGRLAPRPEPATAEVTRPLQSALLPPATGVIGACPKVLLEAQEPGAADADTCLVEQDSSSVVGKTPLILIHGIFGDDSTYFEDLITYLQAVGLTSTYKIYRFHYASDKHTVSQLGQSLRNWLDFYRKLAPQDFDKPFAIVAHSMGGLVARAYMNERNNDFGTFAHRPGGDSVIRLITLATPHHGRSEERRVGKECRSRWSPYH